MPKKALLLCLLLSCLLFSLPIPVQALTASDSVPSVSAQSAILIEADSGRVLFAKNADARLPMASTTKIMTALVALELAPPDRVIQAPAGAVGVEGSSIYLVEGEALTLEQLLYALLLESANDAAAAIAIGLCGSVEAFAEEMNRKATELGLSDTHFTNPHGLDDDAHYTTARELAAIARAALEQELIRTIVSTQKATIPHANVENARLLVNHNKLLRTYDGCIGMKTGYTKRSGRSLVSAAERDGVTLIAVTINAPNDWKDHTAMLDYGFSQCQSVELCQAEDVLYPMQVVGGSDGYVMVGNTQALRVTLPANAGEITQSIECRRFEYAPIAVGDPCGKAVFRCDTDGDGQTEVIGEVALYALYAVEQVRPQNKFLDWLARLLS